MGNIHEELKRLSGSSFSHSTESRFVVRNTARSIKTARRVGRGLSIKMDKVVFKQDRAVRQLDRKYEMLLFKFGGSVHTTAKRNQRYRRKRKPDPKLIWWNGEVYKRWAYSEPGNPPFAHVNPVLRNAISFGVDMNSLSVSIGPLPRTRNIAALLEYGGSQTMNQNWKKDDKGRLIIGPKHRRTMVVRYKARPYMRPAFEQVISVTLPKLLAKSRLNQGLKDPILARAQESVQ